MIYLHKILPVFLLPIPPALMQLAGRLTGKTDAVSRLLGSLTVHSSKIRHTLDWQPPYSVEQGLQATAEWFLQQQGVGSRGG
jgi:UDP-glucose 4-epimerase